MIVFTIRNVRTPFSAIDLNSISLQAYSDSECTTVRRNYEIDSVPIVPDTITTDKMDFSSTSKQIGYSKLDNELVIRFTPKTSFSLTGSGGIRISIPQLYESRKRNMMYHNKQKNGCSSTSMNIVSTEPSVKNNVLDLLYEDMPESNWRSEVVIRCKYFKNPISKAEHDEFAIETFDSEEGQFQIDVSEYY